MSKMLFKRAAAAGAAFVALGFAGAMSLPVASAATTQPAISHSVQAHQNPGYWCGHWPWVYWCDYGYEWGHHGWGGWGHHGWGGWGHDNGGGWGHDHGGGWGHDNGGGWGHDNGGGWGH